MKKVIFINKPDVEANGQYNFSENDLSPFLYDNSNGLPLQTDKFSNKTLYSTVKSNIVNEAIIDANLQFRPEIAGDVEITSNNYIMINNLYVEATDTAHDVENARVEMFMFDNKHPAIEYLGKLPSTMNYTELNKLLHSYEFNFNNWPDVINEDFYVDIEATSRILYIDRGDEPEDKDLGVVCSNYIPLYNLFNENDDDEAMPSTNFESHRNDTTLENYWDATQSFHDGSDGSNTDQIGIFNFDGTQTIYIVISLRGDADRKYGTDETRARVIYVYEINPAFDLVQPDSPTVGGDVTEFVFEPGEFANRQIGGGELGANAYLVRDFSFTISTIPGNSSTIPAGYESIANQVTLNRLITYGGNFNSEFLKTLPSSEIFATEGDDYTPVPKVGVLDSTLDIDLQTYYDSKSEKFIASAPSDVKLSFSISPQTTDAFFDGMELNLDDTPLYSNFNHLFFVVSWDDVDNKFDTWDDVLQDFPDSEIKLIEKQKLENLYTFANVFNNNKSFYSVETPSPTFLKNTYQTAGIKTIKTVMFSYSDSEDSIEPIRWKLITTRVFLDIPSNQYPDFGQVGGDEYTTIPWPYTTPIIGGTDDDSKYKISVQDALSSGNISDTDIIDESLLINDIDNDEKGKSIQNLDFEQIRFFNSNYDMNELLKLSNFGEMNVSPIYLQTLPFPKYMEEFDINTDMVLDVLDSTNPFWLESGRPDVKEFISVFLGFITIEKFNTSIYSFPNYVYEYIETGIIPSGGGNEQPIIPTFLNTSQGEPLLEHPYDEFIYSENKITDILFETITGIGGRQNETWYAQDDHSRISDIDYTRERLLYSEDSTALNQRIVVKDITSNDVLDTTKSDFGNRHYDHAYLFTTFGRNDLQDTLKTFAEGGTEYTMKFEIKFNEWTPNAPANLIARLANTFNDYGDIQQGFPEGREKPFYFDRIMDVSSQELIDWHNHDEGPANNETSKINEGGGQVRLEIGNAGDSINDIQWYTQGLSITEGREYHIKFKIKASDNRPVSLKFNERNDFNQDGNNFSNYGLNETFDVTTDFVEKEFSVTATNVCPRLSNLTENDIILHNTFDDPSWNLDDVGTFQFIYWSAGDGATKGGIVTGWDLRADGPIPSDNSMVLNHNEDSIELFNSTSDNLYIRSRDEQQVFKDKTYQVIIEISGEGLVHDAEYIPGIFETAGGGNLVQLQDGVNEFEWTPTWNDDSESKKVVIRRGSWSGGFQNFKVKSISIKEIPYPGEDLLPCIPGMVNSPHGSFSFHLGNPNGGSGDEYNNIDVTLRSMQITSGKEDGIYSNSALTDKIGEYNEWIPVEMERKLVSDYESNSTSDSLKYPNFELLTNSWGRDFDGLDAILEYEIRKPILIETELFENLTEDELLLNHGLYWTGITPETTFPEESSVEQIFISDNQDNDLINNCRLEFNGGNLVGKSIYDSSGNGNKGLLIGDYKVKKERKNSSMRRDSFIKIPKKTDNSNGAL